MIGYGNSMFLATHGILARSASGGAVDPDAQAFITAAAITDPTQQAAINTLVVDLKGYSIWSKMKAIYPFVGDTSSTHKWNLKDPRDLDAAFRLVFNGGWTHSATGALPNGTNAYADTKLKIQTNISATSHAYGVYSRTNDTTGTKVWGGFDSALSLFVQNNFTSANFISGTSSTSISYTANPTNGLLMGTRRSATDFQAYRSGVSLGTNATNTTSVFNGNIYLGARNNTAVTDFYSNHQLAFAFLSDGLTDTEAANLYTAVQTFQTTLGRSIGTQTVSDADAQAFVTAADIQDQVEANAVNNLVIGMKADGIWTKMKAVYPFVGGTSTSTSYNLKNPAQFQISWMGGVSWSNNGVQFNGSNSYGITGYNVSVNNTVDNISAGAYSRTNSIVGAPSFSALGGAFSGLELWIKNTDNNTYYAVNSDIGSGAGNFVSDTRGMFVVSKLAVNQKVIYRNGTQISSHTYGGGNLSPNFIVHIGARNTQGSISNYDSRQYAFQYIGETLTAAEVGNLTTAVQAFQTALNRNV